ncbi:type VI secretion protein ImpB [Pontixanthobacter aestiaquae]|uniref:Type VI secretion protein ImpB n=1 Tax=Pontixanthobacter aestiaquae TaxID=1509367 RepID=A0A844Z7M3_9SPHN|nr:type VI secretion protein ImpB [Pontixanthobacter aestiaquae]MDN3645487.1 type VI secretion protein ImpB [Pontixanthobacter aestiaquae]MXO83514.1 type VI secretion protein ImpB [Pontixanthobacter aestiaquae]
MFIDFNAYFASVEQYDDPSLVGHPVIVTPLASEHSGAIAASYEAKKLGISRGTSVIDARKLCPNIAIRPARHDRYVELHIQLMKEICQHLPITRVHSIDECLCRLSREEWPIAQAKAKAREIKHGIFRRFGPAIRCSIGLAPSPALAKLASDLEKPNGLIALPLTSLPSALRDLPLRAIPGIGAGIERRLMQAGIADFYSLWNIEPRHARRIWGSVAGERFLYGLHGYDLPIIPEPGDKRMIGHSRVLGGKDRNPDNARIVARALLLKAASRLRHYNLHATGLHIGIRLYPEGAISQDIPVRATQNSWRLLNALNQSWEPIIAGLRLNATKKALKLVSVYLFGLKASPPEPDLFIPEEQDSRDACEAEMWQRIDRLNQRYGMAKVILASQSTIDLNYLGVKIAFSRIPEMAEFADIGGLKSINST